MRETVIAGGGMTSFEARIGLRGNANPPAGNDIEGWC